LRHHAPVPASSRPPDADDPLAPELPPYVGIALADVRLVKTDQDAAAALADLQASEVIGFDTESKPTFLKGEVSTGPHLIQLATDSTAWLFQIGTQAPSESVQQLLKSVLESPTILKAGFGLADDIKRLRAKLGIETVNVIDLATAMKQKGERNSLGAKTAVARHFGQALQKSKKITTTNWAMPRLSEKQILYAADDAHVALKLYKHFKQK
jgi:RNA polymerase sigma factor for flagellar operon FliA